MVEYRRTTLSTDWPAVTRPKRLLARVADRILPKSNPGYDAKMHLVREWLIEFDEEGNPWREIGVGADGKPVLAGPDGQNYGFWLDTNMKIADFLGEAITVEEFERLWQESGAREPG
jgi:hypothetical protein